MNFLVKMAPRCFLHPLFSRWCQRNIRMTGASLAPACEGGYNNVSLARRKKMPIYTYRCESCGVQFERQQSFNDEPLKRCPECNKNSLRKVLTTPGIVFKGSGWYATDHKSPSGQAPRQGKSENKESSSSGESSSKSSEGSGASESSSTNKSESSGDSGSKSESSNSKAESTKKSGE